jgi:hypothetical protein
LPWEFFLGNASHRILGYIHGSRHPAHRVFYNKYSIKFILKEAGIGNWSLLPEDELDIRPDITNVTLRRVTAQCLQQRASCVVLDSRAKS